MAFLAELKRRRVGKVAIGYGAVAWAVTESASVVLPALRVPEWAMTTIVVFLLAGFPVAMVLAWIFDATPQGIQRTEPLPEESQNAAKRLRVRAAYGAMVLVAMAGLGYLLYERGVGRAQAGEPHSSIAVLPFTNLSGDASKDYFSDGMSEELLNLLARVPGLKVASRTSAFAYKGRNVDIRQVGTELGVETVLEGSVRQAGDQVRITAQLIDTESGFHLWSETYDRKLEDIFAVQDEIAQAIVDRLRIQLAPEEQQLAQREKAPTQDVEAYELYLQARAIWKRRGEENLRRADRVVPGGPRQGSRLRPRQRRVGLGVRRSARLQQGKKRRREVLPARRSVRAAGTCRSIRKSARRMRCSRRSTPSAATCSMLNPASFSRSRSSPTSRHRTTGTRSCCRRSVASMRR